MNEKNIYGQTRKRLAVIGGGASGLAAAVFAARRRNELKKDIEITVYEANTCVGKKILATGNGRCNLTNGDMDICHYRGDRQLVQSILADFGVGETLDFFLSCGLMTDKDGAGRYYPLNRRASTVLDFLTAECHRLGIREQTGCKITSVTSAGGKFALNDHYTADAVIFSCGGLAAPALGADGYELLKQSGVSITPLFPALVPLCCADFPKNLKGIRAAGKITLKSKGNTLCEDTGELQYTEYGLSGIPAMQVSRFAAAELLSGVRNIFALVDSAPGLEHDELIGFLRSSAKRNPGLSWEMLLSGIVPKKLAAYFCRECSLSPEKAVGAPADAVLDKIAGVIKRKKYTVTSVRGFDDAQVTAGGVPADEVNIKTLELKKVKKAYICGEMLNVDGECGGYNLQWAWSSGAVAGISAVEEI